LTDDGDPLDIDFTFSKAPVTVYISNLEVVGLVFTFAGGGTNYFKYTIPDPNFFADWHTLLPNTSVSFTIEPTTSYRSAESSQFSITDSSGLTSKAINFRDDNATLDVQLDVDGKPPTAPDFNQWLTI
jgi:hypothetical protein